MKKIDSTEEALGLVVKGQREISQSRGPKRDPETSSSFACYFLQEIRAHQEKLYEYMEMLKKRGSKNSDRASTSGKVRSSQCCRKNR